MCLLFVLCTNSIICIVVDMYVCIYADNKQWQEKSSEMSYMKLHQADEWKEKD